MGCNRGDVDQEILSSAQCRMARAALRIGIRELAKLAHTTSKTVCRLEHGAVVHPIITRNLRVVLEEAGVTLIPPSAGHSEGVCLTGR